jgi:hypothetical protein
MSAASFQGAAAVGGCRGTFGSQAHRRNPSVRLFVSFQKRGRENGVPRTENDRVVPAKIVVPQTTVLEPVNT